MKVFFGDTSNLPNIDTDFENLLSDWGQEKEEKPKNEHEFGENFSIFWHLFLTNVSFFRKILFWKKLDAFNFFIYERNKNINWEKNCFNIFLMIININYCFSILCLKYLCRKSFKIQWIIRNKSVGFLAVLHEYYLFIE